MANKFHAKLDAIKRHTEALNIQLQLSPLNWNTVLVGDATPAELDRLQKRREVIERNYQRLTGYVESYASSENKERRDVALYMARDYERYMTALDDKMDAIISFLARVQADVRLENDYNQLPIYGLDGSEDDVDG